jgi:hypothetical protein
MPNEGEIRRTALARERRQLQELLYRERELRLNGEPGADAVRDELLARWRAYDRKRHETDPVRLLSDAELLPGLKLQLSNLSAQGRHWEAAACWRKMKAIEERLKLQARARRGEIVLLNGGGR